MKPYTLFLVIPLTILLSGCVKGKFTKPNIQLASFYCSSLAATVPLPVECPIAGTVEFDFSLDAAPHPINFNVDQVNHKISILLGTTCKQTIAVGDVRRWSVIRTSTGAKFKDQSSTNTFGAGTVGFPFSGGGCNLKLSSEKMTTAGCKYLLVGTDDVRDWGKMKVKFNLYNPSGSSNYVDVCIVKVGSEFVLWIKHSSYNTNEIPNTCGSQCLSVCGDEISICP